MLLLYTAFCVILLYLSDVSLLNRLLRFLTILRFDVSIPNGYPRFFAISFVMFLCETFFCVFFTMSFPLFRYAALRYCFLALRYGFVRLATVALMLLFLPIELSIDRVDRLKCVQRYFFFQYDQNSTLSSNKTIERSNCCSALRRSPRRNARISLHRSTFRSPNPSHLVLKPLHLFHLESHR